MLPGIAYFVKINLALILFYGFYRLFFYKDTFFHLRRVLLLSFFGIAFLYPLLDVHEWVQRQEPMAEMVTLYSAMLPEVAVMPAAVPDWKTLAATVLGYGYLAGCAALLARFFFQLGSICALAWKSRKTRVCGVRVYVPARPSGPFSFFGWIFVHPEAHSEKELDEILMHERTHVAQYHSVDVVLGELAAIVCWFNPFVWLLKREVRHNLEYLADHVVIRSGYDRKSYQYHLLGLAHHQGMTDLYNSFNVLHLKNRISMMNKKRSRGIIRTKYLLFFPLAAMLMLLSNIEAVARITESFVKERMDEAAGRTEGDVQVKGKVLDSDSRPIIGANVLIKGTTSGTITDLDGNFVLLAPADGRLLFSFPAYQPKEVEIKDLARTNGTVWLQPKVSEAGGQVFTVVEKMPVYPGGQEALMKKIASEVRYPKIAQDNGIQGTVIGSFIVNTDGSVSDAAVVRGVDPSLDQEALRVIRTLNGWTPGEQRGRKVRVKYTVPIQFSLSGKGTSSNTNETAAVPAGKTDASGQVFTVVEKMPVYPGGEMALMQKIASELRYPRIAYENGIQGRVVCSFVINTDGSVSDAAVVRGVDPSIDQAALQVVGTLNGWTPGEQRGRKVRVKYTVPVLFQLNKPDALSANGITLRGASAQQVLCIVDGKEMSFAEFNAMYAPDRIESMTVLKDETAVKQYGEKAKEGVIVVSLKKE